MEVSNDGNSIALLVKGNFLNPSSTTRTISILPDHLLAVSQEGFVAHFDTLRASASIDLLEQALKEGIRVIETGREGWIMPGFIDTHIHAPQYLNAGTALDKPLMEWLEHYTFSSEARIDADPEGLGRSVYTKLVSRMVENGTTGASVFGTLTVEANMVLADCFEAAGIRGQIGKVAMDLNGIPSYIETTADSLARTKSFISLLTAHNAPRPPHKRLVEAVVTPRFVPTCSEELLRGLAAIAKETGARIQSHMCEAEDQVAWSKSMWDGKEDVQVLDEMGLLTSKSLMAHCTHATPSNLALCSSRGVSISHCPLSNVYFSPERTFPLREAWNPPYCLDVGLGSDISGGYQASLHQGMRWAVAVSKLLDGKHGGPKGISWKESIYLATLGGAEALGLRCGTFEVGMCFDAQWIKMGEKGSEVDLWPDHRRPDGERELEEVVEKWWCNGGVPDRKAVWVQGVEVWTGEK